MAGAFPTSPNNLDLHTTDGGTVYQYLDDPSPRWVLYKDGANIHVLKSGDTMTGDLIIDGTIPLILKIATVEKMSLTTDNVFFNVEILARAGHFVKAFNAGNSKNITLNHDNTDGIIHASAGAIETQSTALNVRNIADSDYVDVNANAFNVSSQMLPTDPANWKELLPDFLKKEVVYPIKEQYDEEVEEEYTDEKGKLQTRIITNHKYRVIGEETRTFVSIDLIARLALQKAEKLEQEIEDLKREVIK